VYRLASDCARDEVVRKFVAPALELIMLDKALKGEFDREEALLIFGEMYATAVAGDGHVRPREVVLTVGGELGGGAALLRLATLHVLKELLPDELKFGVRVYVKNGRYYNITTTSGDAAGLMRLLAVSAPSAGGGYLSPRFDELVEEARVEVRPGGVRLTEKGLVAADLTISVGDIKIKYNVYLSDKVELQFASTDRSRVELAARLLRLAGVSAEVRREGGRDVWRIDVTTDRLAAGREELRKALAEIVEAARGKGWVDAGRAEGWLEKLEEGLTLREGWPKYLVRLKDGALVVRFGSTNRNSIEREKQRLENMGLVKGVHFSVKMPEGGKAGYVYIRREGLAYAAWLSENCEDKEQRELAAEFVKLILLRAEEADGGKCDKVCEKVEEIVEEGKAWGSLKLEGFEKRVEVNGKTYVVKVIGGGAEFDEDRKLLRIKITAEVICVGDGCIVDRVEREYTITYGRYGADNAALGFATARADVPGGREADAERLAAVVEALTGKKPSIRRKKNGQIVIECGREHLDGFAHYAELADAITRWLEETSHR
jgi:hypothetical protein